MSVGSLATSSREVASPPVLDVAERLERGELVHYPICPFPLPEGDARAFLFQQQLSGRVHKNISYNPSTDRVSGFRRDMHEQGERLGDILSAFSQSVTRWLAYVLPQYCRHWKLDRASYRPLEEATRSLRQTARNDLLHIDAFPTRPTNGWRILRVFVNINLTEPRVWATSEPFPRLLEKFGEAVGLPETVRKGWAGRLLRSVPRLFGARLVRSGYDAFMLRLHNYLKTNDEFQERAIKRLWTFPPSSMWLAMTDAVSHAVLRGRYALEHSYFISPDTLHFPDQSPMALLARACGHRVSLAAQVPRGA